MKNVRTPPQPPPLLKTIETNIALFHVQHLGMRISIGKKLYEVVHYLTPTMVQAVRVPR